MTVQMFINNVIGLLSPIVIVNQEGSGRIFKGPIISIPDSIKNKEYVSGDLNLTDKEIIITVKEGVTNDGNIQNSIR